MFLIYFDARVDECNLFIHRQGSIVQISPSGKHHGLGLSSGAWDASVYCYCLGEENDIMTEYWPGSLPYPFLHAF